MNCQKYKQKFSLVQRFNKLGPQIQFYNQGMQKSWNMAEQL